MFWWMEGNYSCDCNRSAEFQRAGGIAEDDLVWTECSDGQYSVLSATLADGTVITIEGNNNGK